VGVLRNISQLKYPVYSLGVAYGMAECRIKLNGCPNAMTL